MTPPAAAGARPRRPPGWTAPAAPLLTLLILLALGALSAWSLWQRYTLLTASPYPVGVDGYYYAVQVRALLDTGSLHYPAPPVCFWLMAPLAAVTDPITGAKLGAAVAGAIAIAPAYVLGRRVSGSRSCGLLAAVLVATSAESLYLTTEFVKSSLGLGVALIYLCALAWALDGRDPEAGPGRWSRAAPGRAALPAALLAVTFATHKLAAAVAVIASMAPLVVAWRQSVRPRALRALSYALALASALALAAGAAAPERFLSIADVRLLGDAFTTRPDWTFAALRLPGNRALLFQREVAIAGALAVLALAWHLLRARVPGIAARDPVTAADRALVVGPAALGLFAAVPFLDVADPQGLAFRVRLVAFVPLALCAAAVCGAVTSLVTPRRRALLVVPFTAAFFLARPATPGEGVVTAHPAMQQAVRNLRGVVPREHVVIVPERHIAFMVAWYTDNHVRLRPEPVPPSRRWRLVPMARMGPELRRALRRARTRAPAHVPRPRSLHPRHPHGLVVMPEVTWQWLLEQLPPRARDAHRRWPPT